MVIEFRIRGRGGGENGVYYKYIRIALKMIWEFVEYIYRNELLNLEPTSSNILTYQQIRSILKADDNFNLRYNN